MTLSETENWWMVDLGRNEDVARVEIYNLNGTSKWMLILGHCIANRAMEKYIVSNGMKYTILNRKGGGVRLKKKDCV